MSRVTIDLAPSRFVQIVVCEAWLHALDEAGDVWQYSVGINGEAAAWRRLNMARRVGAPHSERDEAPERNEASNA